MKFFLSNFLDKQKIEVLRNHLQQIEIKTLNLDLKNQKANQSLQAQQIKTHLKVDLVKVKGKDVNP